VGQWAARRGDREVLRSVASLAAARAEHSPPAEARENALFAGVAVAHLARLQGDTAAAIRRLSELQVTASARDLMWQPWDALAGERLALAELLLATGRPAEAERTAEELDSHRAVVYLIYLPAALELRARAANMLGRASLAAAYRKRLAALRRESPAIPLGSP
jgi:hypothetical protein